MMYIVYYTAIGFGSREMGLSANSKEEAEKTVQFLKADPEVKTIRITQKEK